MQSLIEMANMYLNVMSFIFGLRNTAMFRPFAITPTVHIKGCMSKDQLLLFIVLDILTRQKKSDFLR